MKCRYGVIARTTDVNLDGAGLHKDNYAIPWGGGGQREKLFSRTLSAPSGEMCLSPRGWGGATCPDSLALCWQHREERDGDWYDMTASVGRSACVNKEGSSLFFFNIRGRAVCVCVRAQVASNYQPLDVAVVSDFLILPMAVTAWYWHRPGRTPRTGAAPERYVW